MPSKFVIRKIVKQASTVFKKRHSGLNLHDDLRAASHQRSVMFISFHKCATTFFNIDVFRHLSSHTQVDYLSFLYNNTNQKIQLEIRQQGFLYGVIRLQSNDHPRHDMVKELLAVQNLQATRQIFWTRDPRDILISSYYSFKDTHGFSKVDCIKIFQQKRRAQIQALTVDQYVIKELPKIKYKFEMMGEIISKSKDYVILQYEEMIGDFDRFFEKLTDFIDLEASFQAVLFKETRPNETEDRSRHKRSGKAGAYKHKLRAETIAILNQELHDVLEEFGYLDA